MLRPQHLAGQSASSSRMVDEVPSDFDIFSLDL